MESISQIYDETQPFTLDKIGDNLNSPTQFELTDLEENKAISNEIPDPRNKEKVFLILVSFFFSLILIVIFYPEKCKDQKDKKQCEQISNRTTKNGET